MNDQKNRREVLKLLSLAGFGLVIPSCVNEQSSALDKTARSILPQTDSILEPKLEVLKDSLEVLEQKIEENNVIFLSQIDEDYESSRIGFNLDVLKYPAIIALCKNKAGVIEAVKYANEHQLKIAVKSGGHSFEGFSSNNDGLVINLSLMNQMTWLENHELKAGPAVLLKDLYDFILPQKRILPSGSCGTVGLSGITLGGGYGFFARQYGLTCDHLLEATIIDGEGNEHIAREGDELMWALRGGGNGNFGIVTALTYKTHPLPTGFKRHRIQAYKLDKDRAKLLMKTWFEHSIKLPDTCFSAFVLNGKTVTILITNYAEAESETLSVMADTLSQLMDKTSISDRKPLENALSTYYGTQHPIYFKNSSAGYYDSYETIEGCIDDVLDIVLNHKLIYQINTLGGQINAPEHEMNSCYPHRKFPYLCELQSYWKKDKDRESRIIAFNAVQTILTDYGISAQYRNYPNISFPNWEEAYYGVDNYKRLQNIKLEFDRNNNIQHDQSIKLAADLNSE